eukprot:11567566-Ditylum_brightwellii.AAC.2
MDRAHDNGISKVLGSCPDQLIGTRKRKTWSRGLERQSDGLIDMLVLQEDKSKWLKEYGWEGKEPLLDYYSYKTACQYMKYAPGLCKCSQSGRMMIIPLNGLPSGVDNLFE